MLIPARRVKSFAVREDDILDLILGRKEIHIVGLPPDAHFFSVHLDIMSSVIRFFVESQEFEEVPINVVPPILDNVWYQMIEKGNAAQEEREACAQIADEYASKSNWSTEGEGYEIAAAIRARRELKT